MSGDVKHDEFGWLWKEAVVAYFRMSISTEKLREKNQSYVKTDTYSTFKLARISQM
jgi:hypothetical protein